MIHQPTQRETLNVFPSYTGGCTTVFHGYVFEHVPNHPRCNGWGYVAQHRLVAETLLGRLLSPSDIVHHKDGDTQNNAPDNLEVTTRSRHAAFHREGKRKYPLTEHAIREALRETGGLKKACALLGTTPDTLRRHYPDLLLPYRRKTPTRIDDPEVVSTIRRLAPDPQIGYREVANLHGIAMMTVKRLCAKHQIVWQPKARTRDSYPGRPRNSANRQA